jgi:YVTN family beta-propeller protein
MIGILSGGLVQSGVFAQNNLIEPIASPGMIFEVLALNKDLGTKKKPKYRSPAQLIPSRDKTKMYIVEQSAKKIAEYDLVNRVVLRRFDLPNEVTGAALSKDGSRLYVTCGSEIWPAGMVCVVNTATGLVEKRLSEGIGHYPRSPVLTPDGRKLYVCNMFSNDLSVIDVATLTAIKRVDLVREPYCAAITPDGTRLVIGNSLPNDMSTDSALVSCEITIFDAVNDVCPDSAHIRLTRGSHSVFGIAVSPDGRYAFASHLIGKFNLVGSTVAGGWLHTNNVAVIDIAAKKFINDVSLDFANEGRANPWDIVFNEPELPTDTLLMVVVHAGSNHLSIIKYNMFMDTVLKYTQLDTNLGQKFSYLPEGVVRKSLDIKSKGTRACAIVGKKVFSTGFFDDHNAIMEEHDLLPIKPKRGDTLITIHTIGEPQQQTGERKGEMWFYDGDLCFQQWQSCHSCHPLTRPDALNWILNSGVNAFPKNAKSMLYSWWTPPTSWIGGRIDAQASIIAGIQLELFQTPKQEISVPMDTFFMYLKPMSSPFLAKGRLNEAAQRGRALYYDKAKVDCITCHKGPLFYDEKRYYCGVADPFDQSMMNTPILTETWRTAPYGHLGTYTGVLQILELDAHSNMVKNKKAGILTVQDFKDLVEFTNSL